MVKRPKPTCDQSTPQVYPFPSAFILAQISPPEAYFIQYKQ
jgi:hypothetical protein